MPSSSSTTPAAAAFDTTCARRETPGCTHVLHFNNAGAALPPRPVLGAQRAHLAREARTGGYEAAREAEQELAQVYEAAARLLNAQPDEIALQDSATRAWTTAFYALPLTEGDRILTTRASYASNYIAFLQRARRTGARVEVVPSDEAGQIDLHAFEEAIDERTALVALTHVPTNGGLVNPAAEVGQIARAAGVPYLLDACQSAGQLPLDVEKIGCDFLSATGRKILRGPRGTGFLYVRKPWIERLEPPMLDLHAATWIEADRYEIRTDARRFEFWEASVAARLGLGAALHYAMDWGLEHIWARIQHLADMLRTELRRIDGVTVRDLGATRSGIVTFSAAQADAATLRAQLRERHINVSVSTPASTRLDAQARALPDLVRASVHYYNTEGEVGRFAAALRGLLAQVK